jgi:magnesium transporter
MQFELTKDYLDQLKTSIKKQDQVLITKQGNELHPADIAEILDNLNLEEAKYFYNQIEEEKAAEVLIELEEDVRESFLASLSSKEIADQVIENIDSDDAADVISELSETVKEEVISHLEDPEQASDIIELLTHDENSAGGLMGKEFIAVNKNLNVVNCLKELRKQAEKTEEVYAIYVIDDDNKLLGLLSLNKMLLAPTQTPISEIYEQEVIKVTTETKSEDVAIIMKKYDLIVLPVVDESGKLEGRITIDDVVDLIKEEAEKDYQMASGISEDVESTDSIWDLTRARLPWLMIGMVGGILGARVIGAFDIHDNIEMALFIPLIAAMGGNVGVQSAAIVVQGLANKSISIDSIFEKLIKELGVALLNGFICSVLILTIAMLLGYGAFLSITVSIALLSVIVFAALFGTFVPLALNKYNIDPALATGPFITTVNDILGLMLYFLIGQMVTLLI